MSRFFVLTLTLSFVLLRNVCYGYQLSIVNGLATNPSDVSLENIVDDEAYNFRSMSSKYPSHVIIEAIDKFPPEFLCSGVLIHSRMILTSASCFQNRQANQIRIRDSNNKVKKVKSIFINEEYNASPIYNDIALLKLADPLVEDNVTFNLLPKELETSGSHANDVSPDYVVHENAKGFVTSWHDVDLEEKMLKKWKASLPSHLELLYQPDRFPGFKPAELVQPKVCEQEYRDLFSKNGYAFDKVFPNGIVGSRLACVRLEESSYCKYVAFQFLTATSIVPPEPRSEDDMYTFEGLALIGTRAGSNVDTLNVLRCANSKTNVPIIFTDIHYYNDWIQHYITYMDYY